MPQKPQLRRDQPRRTEDQVTGRKATGTEKSDDIDNEEKCYGEKYVCICVYVYLYVTAI
jgi:hypothetical protein